MRPLRALAPKIDQSIADWYTLFFPSLNSGATFVLESFPNLFETTLAEMRGKFNQGELSMVLDVLNGHGTILTGGYGGQHICLSIEDSFLLYPGMYEQKWEITDPENFMHRLQKLTRWQKVCLEIWAAGFWEQGNLELADYCQKLR